jgi:hypothetical protein
MEGTKMARGRIRIDPQVTPRQRHFDQQVADILNGLIMSGAISPGGSSGGWVVVGAGESNSTLGNRVFNFQPRYGEWGA